MTIADHRVTGATQAPAVAFSNPSGTVGLDVTRSPHVRGTIKTPSKAGLFAALDPRTGPQRVTLSCSDVIGGSARTFDLGVRRATANGDGTISVELASDEAILEDTSPETDDYDVLNGGNTAGNVVAYVLSKIGAALDLANSDGLATSLQPYWTLTNKVINPRYLTTTKGTATYAGASAITPGVTWSGRVGLRYASAAAGSLICIAGYDPASASMTAIPVTPGERREDLPLYTDKVMTVGVRLGSEAVNHALAIGVRWHLEGGGTIDTGGTSEAGLAGWRERYRKVEVPFRAKYMEIRVSAAATTANTFIHVTDVTVTESRVPVGLWNGASPDDANYTYDWDDTADDSTSTRYALIERDPDSLVWGPDKGGMSFLAPLLQPVGLRLVCDEQRVWTLRDGSHTSPGATSLEYGVNMGGGYQLDSSIDGADWFDAATVVYRWVRDGRTRTKTDSFELNTPPRKRIRRVLEVPYPGPGRAENLVTRAQSGGGSTTAPAMTQWGTTTEQPVTMTTPDGTRTGTVGAVTFDLGNDTMTVTIRAEVAP